MITRKGQATRSRIVAAAADLMYQQGVGGTSTDDVRAAAGVSASQIYHYFGDKQSLTCAVVEHWIDVILDFHRPVLARLDGVEALRSWAESIVTMQQANGFRGGCPLGSLASELSDSDDAARDDVVVGYQRWQDAIAEGLAAMQERGALSEAADVDQLALALLASLQGGLLLAQAKRSGDPLRTALSTTIDNIASYAATETS